jgi:tRNA uridine 5-carbamoylmethylation protein Kti12
MMITITISGPRAIGKSALARHLTRVLENEGHHVLVSNTVNTSGLGKFEPQHSREILIREDHGFLDNLK